MMALFIKANLDLSEKYNLSVKLNTDGVAIFRSSQFGVWPLFLLINELPPSLRYVNKSKHPLCYILSVLEIKSISILVLTCFPSCFSGGKTSTGYLLACGLEKKNLSFQLSLSHLLIHYGKLKLMV